MKLFVVLTIVVLTLLCSQAWAYEESRKCIRKNNNVEVCTIRTIQYRRGSLRRACWVEPNGVSRCHTPEQLRQMGHGK
ncbi:hypothetical protein Q1695_005454 [Nippostrongylus brasiliensis]|nr:hypothetical protein Q1695_005454 [Nippostrongylus brasiliensis]